MICGVESLSYGELNARANQLAHHLINLGVAPEALVGVCLERSAELVVALLAILKSGGAYLPLNPEYPDARLAYLLADAAPVLILSTTTFRDRLPEPATVLVLDAAETRAALSRLPAYDPEDRHRACRSSRGTRRMSSTLPAPPAIPRAWSWSTERLVNKISTLNDFLDIAPTTRYGAITSVSFDPLMEQILCPLCAGAACVIIPNGISNDPRRFAAYAERHGLSVLNGSPGLIDGLLRDGRFPIRLDVLLLGGDVLPAGLANKLQSGGVARQILNLYGPTETCIDASSYRITDAMLLGSVPIGVPLPNYRLYVLDASLEPVPVGATGELYVAGAGLARGYLNALV